jgi:hypothetical protein
MIAHLKQQVTQTISDEIFSNHPECADLDGERDRQFFARGICQLFTMDSSMSQS